MPCCVLLATHYSTACKNVCKNVCMYVRMYVRMYVCMCSPVSCLRSAVQHRACACSTLLSVISFFLWSRDVECMTAAELANSTP